MLKTGHYRGSNWTDLCLITNSLLSDEQRTNLLEQFKDMYIDNYKKKDIKGEGFEGLASRIGHFTLGGFGGIQYDVELDIEGEIRLQN